MTDSNNVTKDSMDSVGVFLKRERELREITLEEVAKGTNISRSGLKAIEEDRFDDLPAEVFVRGFIRSYAEFIGIDPEDAILRLESTMGPGNREMNKVHRIGPGYEELKKSMEAKGLDPEKFEFYLQAFKTGMPPHGGVGLGVERLTQKILGLDNVKKATLFPREINRIDTLLNK